MKKTLYSFLIVFTFCFAKCEKDKIDSNGLPPATQEGKNTLGFMLNGEAWMPQGNNGTGNLDLYYDPSFQGGVFNLSAYRNMSNTNGSRQSLVMFGDSIQIAQKFLLPNKNKFGFTYWDEAKHCTYNTFDSTTKILSGYFDIQKLDRANNIFAGEFEIKFTKTGCADVQISKGRFDMKF
jgi:hypothetical protein